MSLDVDKIAAALMVALAKNDITEADLTAGQDPYDAVYRALSLLFGRGGFRGDVLDALLGEEYPTLEEATAVFKKAHPFLATAAGEQHHSEFEALYDFFEAAQ